jgi:hypothetical protein
MRGAMGAKPSARRCQRRRLPLPRRGKARARHAAPTVAACEGVQPCAAAGEGWWLRAAWRAAPATGTFGPGSGPQQRDAGRQGCTAPARLPVRVRSAHPPLQLSFLTGLDQLYADGSDGEEARRQRLEGEVVAAAPRGQWRGGRFGVVVGR